jgi:glycosyltransferase involved in cell wall biosynthesis
MRVLTLTNLYPPHALGGYEMSCADVMERFASRGHEVTVMTTDTRRPDVADVDQPHVQRALRWYWSDHEIVHAGVTSLVSIERHNVRLLQRALADTRPDVVSVWAMGAMSLGLIDLLNNSGLPVVYVVCDEWPRYGPRLDGWLAWCARRRGRLLGPVVRRLTALPTAMPAPRNATFAWLSNFVRDRVLAATGWSVGHETVTYSGIDPADFPVATLADADRPWRWRLLCVGRLEPRKGFAAAVEALASFPPEATLRIVGPDDGTHRDQLTALARRFDVGDRVTFGQAPRHELRTIYADADALLFTSAWEEPFGLVPVEAMACATPVVAAATGGATEFLSDDANCLVVPPNDAAALVPAVEKLAADSRLRRRLVEGGLRTASELSVDALADVLESWHNAAASRYVDGEPAHRAQPRGASR